MVEGKFDLYLGKWILIYVSVNFRVVLEILLHKAHTFVVKNVGDNR